MTSTALRLTCLATAAITPAIALDINLQTGPDSARITTTLENQQWSNGRIIDDQAVGRLSGAFRWYDVGIRLDGVIALDGRPTDTDIHDFETTEFTLNIDYLIEIEQLMQIRPFIEVTSYPYISGSPKFSWLGLEMWYLTPLEGLETGASIQYNLADSQPGDKAADPDHHVYGEIGVRYFYQEAPLDAVFWNTIGIGNSSYHQVTTGADTQGLTTFNLGGKLTLPLPWEEMWMFGSAENIWYVDSEDREALADASQSRSNLIFKLGVEWRAAE